MGGITLTMVMALEPTSLSPKLLDCFTSTLLIQKRVN